MGRTAWVIAIGFSITTVMVVLVAVVVAMSTRVRGRADPEKLAHRERTWLWVVLGLMAALLLATIFFTPYYETAGGGAKQVVRVDAFQFGFQIQPARVRAGEPVEFRVTARDVNHGFAVYDAKDRLVFQVQAMPERTAAELHTFDRPGRYRVLCLEFCGFGHQAMAAQIEVTR